MNAIKENKPLKLDQYLDVALQNVAVAEYIELKVTVIEYIFQK